MLSRWQEARRSASWWAHSSRRESPSGAASRPTGTSPLPSTAVSSTGQALPWRRSGDGFPPRIGYGAGFSRERRWGFLASRAAWGRAGFKPAPTGGNGCPPATLPTGGRTRGSAPTAGRARIPLPPVNGGRVSNPRLQAGTVVRQQHCLPAGGHVGPPLRLVARASPSRPSMEGGFQTRAYRRERLSASNIAYRRADTWVICSN